MVVTYDLKPVAIAETSYNKKPVRDETWRNLLTEEDIPLFNSLRDWRIKRCKEDGVPPYIVCTNHQLALMAKNRPQNLNKLMEKDKIINLFDIPGWHTPPASRLTSHEFKLRPAKDKNNLQKVLFSYLK